MKMIKRHIANFRNTILSGILLFLPIYFIWVLIQKLWYSLIKYGSKIAGMSTIKQVAGIGATAIITTILLILIFYICGLLIRFSFIGKIKNWIENSLLQYIPGYLTYKVKMEESLTKKVDKRLPVLVTTPEGSRPGLEIERLGQSVTVYIPNSPDTNYGEVWLVDSSQVTLLKGDVYNLLKSVQFSGKGLLANLP
jgi:uncharacterized membrane protein